MNKKLIHTYSTYIYIYHIVRCIKGVLKCIKSVLSVLINTVVKCIKLIQFNTGLIQGNLLIYRHLTPKCIKILIQYE